MLKLLFFRYSDEYGLISPQYLEHVNLLSLDDGRKYRRFFRQLFNIDRLSDPVKLSSRIVAVSVCLFGKKIYYFFFLFSILKLY